MSKVQDHRYVRVETVLRETGFFDYAATLGMKCEDFIKAIEMAPSIKPFRHTYLHEESYRKLAKKIVLFAVLNQNIADSPNRSAVAARM